MVTPNPRYNQVRKKKINTDWLDETTGKPLPSKPVLGQKKISQNRERAYKLAADAKKQATTELEEILEDKPEILSRLVENHLYGDKKINTGDVLQAMSEGRTLSDPYVPGKKARLVLKEDEPPDANRRTTLKDLGMGEVKWGQIPDPDKTPASASPYFAVKNDGEGVKPWPGAIGYTVMPEHQALAQSLLSDIHIQKKDQHTFNDKDTGDFLPWSRKMDESKKEEYAQRQRQLALEQPAAKAFTNSFRLQQTATAKDVGPPNYQTLSQIEASEVQGKIPEIHYVITDLADRVNQSKGTDAAAKMRLKQWAMQGIRITQNYDWYVKQGQDNQPVHEYYTGLIQKADKPGEYLPTLELAPHKFNNRGAKKAQRYLKQLEPPPANQPAPQTPNLGAKVKDMTELAQALTKWDKEQRNKDGGVKPPFTTEQAVELYTKTLPELGKKHYISNITTPWYVIDEGKVTFQQSNGGFSEVLRKAGEWWPVQIGYSVKDITLKESQKIEDALRAKYNLRAVEHFASNSGVQSSLLSIPGHDRFGTSMGLPWVLGYSTDGKDRTTGALNKRLKAGDSGDFTDGKYSGQEDFEGTRESWIDPEQPHKTLQAGVIELGTDQDKDGETEKINWVTENTSVAAIGKDGKWDEGKEANAGMGRIKESAFQKWLASGELSASAERSLENPEKYVRQFQIWHIDNTGPYKGMLEVIPDKSWNDGEEVDMVMSNDMVKKDVKFTRGAVTRGTIKYAHDQDPYVRIGFLQQIANLHPMVDRTR